MAASGARQEVLRDIAFSLRPGEVGAFVGPSGCGKSTMMRIIAGLDRDYDGTVVRAPDGRIGMVFQEPRLLAWRTVEQNVRLLAPQADDLKLDAIFESLGLAAHRAHFPGELSVGLARRVALARAFAFEPDLLILDEPFISLDQSLAERLRDELAALVERWRVTTILVTHDEEEAIRLADRIFLLAGRPAHIVGEIAVPAPRTPRPPTAVAALRAEMAKHRS